MPTGSHLNPSTVVWENLEESLRRQVQGWLQQLLYDAWRQRSLADQELVYLWVDGIYLKAGLQKEKAALLVAVGALADGRKVILAAEAGARQSTERWSRRRRELKRRGMNCPRLVIRDGHLGIEGFPEAGPAPSVNRPSSPRNLEEHRDKQ